jgi:hypothetical protein
MHRASYWDRTHLVINAIGMRTGIHIGLLPTAMHNPSEGIVLTLDFAARALSMPAGTGPHSLIHATIKKFAANDSVHEIIEAAESSRTYSMVPRRTEPSMRLTAASSTTWEPTSRLSARVSPSTPLHRLGHWAVTSSITRRIPPSPAQPTDSQGDKTASRRRFT